VLAKSFERGRFLDELGTRNLQLRADEDKLRAHFAQAPSHAAVSEPHVGLLAVFDGDGFSSGKNPHLYRELRGHRVFERISTKAQDRYSWRKAARCIGPETLDDFQILWAANCGPLKDFDFEGSNMIAAGGSVLRCLLGRVNTDSKGKKYACGSEEAPFGFTESDIDLFFVGAREEEAILSLKELYDHLKQDSEVTVVRTQHAITFVTPPRGSRIWTAHWTDPTYRKGSVIQVILRLYKSPAEVLLGFDVDACCVAYDGSEVWGTPRSKRALSGMVNVADADRMSYTYEARLLKYAHRGFTVIMPGFEPKRVPMGLFDVEYTAVRGAARLLRLDRIHEQRMVQAAVELARAVS